MPRGVLLYIASFILITHILKANAVRETKLYDALGIAEDADERTIQKAYRKQAMKYHPDRNPDKKEWAEKKFREVAAAYEILSDPEKRSVYDQFGEDAALGKEPQGGPGGGGGHYAQGDPFTVFQTVFGGGGFPGGGGVGGERVQFHFASGGSGGFGGPAFGSGRGFGGRAPQQQPERGLYDGEIAVKTLTPESFPRGGDGWVWMIEFYAPWCGHCRQLAPKWMKLAKSLAGIVKVGAVDCEDHGDLCREHGVQGYPTIVSIGPSGSVQQYHGERSAKALRDHALSLLPRDIPVLSSQAQLTSFLENKPQPEWGVSLLLFTSKPGPSSLSRSLALRYKGKVAIAEVLSSASDLLTQFGIASVPAAVAVCGGDPEAVVRHEGAPKSDALRSFISGFRDGSKCTGAIKLGPGTDIHKFKVRQLKQLLAAKDAACSDCVEKPDYVERVRQVYGLV